MVNELIILGIVYETPKTGYDIKKICETQFMHYSDVNTSSIYFSLKKLEKEKLIGGKNLKEGHLIKKVFTITTKGKEEFKRTLIEHISSKQFPKDSFNVGMSFANIIDKKTLKELLLKRLDNFEKSLKKMSSVRKEHSKKLPPHYELLFSRGEMHMKTEIKWLKWSIKQVE